MTTTEEEIIEIVAKRAKRAVSTITKLDDLYEDLWISTDDFAEIANEIQEKFGESIPVEDFRSNRVCKVGDIVDRVKGQTWGDSYSSIDDDDYGNGSSCNYVSYFPSELNGWNWGACLFGCIWGIFNGVYKMSFLLFLLSIFIPFSGGILSIIIFGMKGNKWAWQAKSWASVDEFKRVQHRWAIAGVCITIIYPIITLLISCLM